MSFQSGQIVKPAGITKTLGVSFYNKSNFTAKLLRPDGSGVAGRWLAQCITGEAKGSSYWGGYSSTSVHQPDNIRPGTEFVLTESSWYVDPDSLFNRKSEPTTTVVPSAPIMRIMSLV